MHIIQECRVICYIELFFIDFSKVFRLQSLFICFNCNVYRSWTSTIKYIADQWTSQVGFHPAKNGGYLRSVVEVRAAAAVVTAAASAGAAAAVVTAAASAGAAASAAAGNDAATATYEAK